MLFGAFGLLADPGGGDVLRRRRLRHRRALRRGDLAVAPQDHRHGLGLRLRRHRQDPGPGRAGADRRLRQLPEARRAAAADSDRFPLSRLLVPDGRGGLLFLRDRDQGQVDRADRPRTGPPPTDTPHGEDDLGHADPVFRRPGRRSGRDRARRGGAAGRRGRVERDRGDAPPAAGLLDKLHEAAAVPPAACRARRTASRPIRSPSSM